MHTAMAVQDWMADKMQFWPKPFWPPQSPNLNPLDYSIRGQVQSNASRVCHPNVEALKDSMNKEWYDMKKNYIINVCKAFCCCLKAVIEADGGHAHDQKLFSVWGRSPMKNKTCTVSPRSTSTRLSFNTTWCQNFLNSQYIQNLKDYNVDHS